MEHPADFWEPGRSLKSIRDFRADFFESLPGQDELLRIRSLWRDLCGPAAERSWPSRLEQGVLIVESSGAAAQDLRMQANQIRGKLEDKGIKVKKILVEMESNRV